VALRHERRPGKVTTSPIKALLGNFNWFVEWG
jgi:hypothetical protein